MRKHTHNTREISSSDRMQVDSQNFALNVLVNKRAEIEAERVIIFPTNFTFLPNAHH